MKYEVFTGARLPIKAWTRGVQVEDAAKQQLLNLAGMPFIHSHVAAMPDVHWGMGATVGSVIATKGAIIPAAVGVDIGCGMAAQRTTLTASDLPDSLQALRSAIEARIPHGRTDNGGPRDRGAWGTAPDGHYARLAPLMPGLKAITDKHPKIEQAAARAPMHAGTLGTGQAMKHKTAELTGALLHKAVAKADGISDAEALDLCTDWELGKKVILANNEAIVAQLIKWYGMTGWPMKAGKAKDNFPLWMRAYVASKLGDEVDL